jgi:mannitol/fructose-specific phosphotransferase system IIA component (Ntr-type)
MRLSQILVPSAVRVCLQARTKREVIVELVDLLEAAHGFSSQGEILDRVLRREADLSTAVFPGAAIPHGKARSVDRLAAACGLAPEGVAFDSMDGEPTRLFVLLVSPENFSTQNVRLLANIARLLRQDQVRADLLAARTPEEFLAVVDRGESAFIPQG